MLIDKVQACTSAVEELSRMRENAVSVDAFESAVNKLDKVADTSDKFVATVTEMGKYEFCAMTCADEDVENIRNAIMSCLGAVNSMMLTKKDVTALNNLLEAEQKKLSVFWKLVAKGLVDPIKSFLGVIQQFAENKTEIAQLMNALDAGAKADPTVTIVRSLVNNVAKANKISESFQISKNVGIFLQKVKNGTATYEDITPEVVKWITEHKLKSRIKISFR